MGKFEIGKVKSISWSISLFNEGGEDQDEININIKDFYDSISESDDSSSPKNISNDLSEIKKESSKF